MIKLTSLSQLARQTYGKQIGPDVNFNKVSIDSRTLQAGDLFVAIKGEQFDGHQYLPQVIKQGCCAAVISCKEPISKESANSFLKTDPEMQRASLLIVEDTEKALGEISLINRREFEGPVIGLTGSAGKTSTKNMLEVILKEKGPTCATEGNFNNEIGVPLTLLRLESKHKYAVVEMGARAKGDIRYLSQYVQADVAILLNAGLSHIEVFGSYENIVEAKGEIYEALKDDGIVILNADDPAVDIWRNNVGSKELLSFSLTKSHADVYASAIECEIESCRYQLNYLGSSQEINLPVPGKHNIANSLAAAAAAIAIDFDLKTIASGLAKLLSVEGRLNAIKLSKNLTLIDDSYNANPASMKASLDVLSLRNGYKIAVLGEMAELGKQSLALHLEIAKYAADMQIDHFYFIGQYSEKMAACFESNATACETKKEILELICQSLMEESTILVKGSRSAGMDELVEMFEGWAA